MMMNLSLGPKSEDRQEDQKPMEGSTVDNIEKEHMFDKVVTPSDVGKLNRLVIPKQHAERYFPLDSSSNEKGLLLNFEDRTGKSWRFRYSYWNSSQSYVMTKGWSRFVKDKKLDAGDIVSFQRGVGEIGRDRFFIDWRRRPKLPDPTSMVQFGGGAIFPRFYSFPPPAVSIPRNYENFHRFNNGSFDLSYSHLQHFQFPQDSGYRFGDHTAGRSYMMSSLERNQAPVVATPLVIDSVPVVHGRSQPVATAVGKRLRLFGVEMECGSMISPEEESSSSVGSMPRGAMGTSSSSSSSSSSLPALRLASSEESSLMEAEAAYDHFSKKGKSSLSFDLDQ